MTSTSLRARPAVRIAAPLSERLKWRLVLAVTDALTHPKRSMPVLRRTVLAAVAELRTARFPENGLRELFETLIEDVARERGIDNTSLMSGAPRWRELVSRVNEWIDIAG
jgi:hypothetical protein